MTEDIPAGDISTGGLSAEGVSTGDIRAEQNSTVSPAPGRPRRMLWIVLPVALTAVLLLLLLATRDSAAERRAGSPLLGDLAPEILGTTTAGQSFDLDHWRGRWVLVNFFSTNCVPCVIEHPELLAFHRAGGDAEIVSVVFDDDPQQVAAFFETNGGDWPVLAYGSGATAIAYGVTGVPESYLVAPSGQVVWKAIGGISAAAVAAVIAEFTVPA